MLLLLLLLLLFLLLFPAVPCGFLRTNRTRQKGGVDQPERCVHSVQQQIGICLPPTTHGAETKIHIEYYGHTIHRSLVFFSSLVVTRQDTHTHAHTHTHTCIESDRNGSGHHPAERDPASKQGRPDIRRVSWRTQGARPKRPRATDPCILASRSVLEDSGASPFHHYSLRQSS